MCVWRPGTWWRRRIGIGKPSRPINICQGRAVNGTLAALALHDGVAAVVGQGGHELHRHEGDHVRRFSREAPHPEDVTVFTAGTPVIFRDSLMPQEDTPDQRRPTCPGTRLSISAIAYADVRGRRGGRVGGVRTESKRTDDMTYKSKNRHTTSARHRDRCARALRRTAPARAEDAVQGKERGGGGIEGGGRGEQRGGKDGRATEKGEGGREKYKKGDRPSEAGGKRVGCRVGWTAAGGSERGYSEERERAEREWYSRAPPMSACCRAAMHERGAGGDYQVDVDGERAAGVGEASKEGDKEGAYDEMLEGMCDVEEGADDGAVSEGEGEGEGEAARCCWLRAEAPSVSWGGMGGGRGAAVQRQRERDWWRFRVVWGGPAVGGWCGSAAAVGVAQLVERAQWVVYCERNGKVLPATEKAGRENNSSRAEVRDVSGATPNKRFSLVRRADFGSMDPHRWAVDGRLPGLGGPTDKMLFSSMGVLWYVQGFGGNPAEQPNCGQAAEYCYFWKGISGISQIWWRHGGKV
ncbi:hypothetical protein C8J57DRAFT_1472419 [Mycena rebaudengoi]|nr:hypothetical protein C8J57DRAFT_1472419 [Mycena rebaudengoi]